MGAGTAATVRRILREPAVRAARAGVVDEAMRQRLSEVYERRRRQGGSLVVLHTIGHLGAQVGGHAHRLSVPSVVDCRQFGLLCAQPLTYPADELPRDA